MKTESSSSPSSLPLSAVQMILGKRRGDSHSKEEIDVWLAAYVAGEIPDYQMSAWLMAVCWRGMTPMETSLMTRAMVHSGQTVNWKEHDNSGVIRVDKHSTGGVGDKISLILAPLVAACSEAHVGNDSNLVDTMRLPRIQVPMMAGRGLGHTGGTIDKLESLTGYRTDLSMEEFQRTVQTVGCSITGTTPDMVPADRLLYGLRDVTGTVQCFPLQTASILSKKVAEGPQVLVLDVKYGRGAFQATATDAVELAEQMLDTGSQCGLEVSALLTRMDVPIGRAVGNWIEVKECIQYMQKRTKSQEDASNVSKTDDTVTSKNNDDDNDDDLVMLVLCLAAQMLHKSSQVASEGKNDNDNEDQMKKQVMSFDDCYRLARKILHEGKALEKFREMVLAQGGNVMYVDEFESSYPQAPYQMDVYAQHEFFDSDGNEDSSGQDDLYYYIADIDALKVGQVSVVLGAGRQVAREAVDPLAGVYLHKIVGEEVQMMICDGTGVAKSSGRSSSVLATLYTSKSQKVLEEGAKLLRQAIVIRGRSKQDGPPPKQDPIVSHIVTTNSGVTEFVIPNYH